MPGQKHSRQTEEVAIMNIQLIMRVNSVMMAVLCCVCLAAAKPAAADDRAATIKKPLTQKEVALSVAVSSGTPLKDILRDAVQSGDSIESVIAALGNVGVDPAAVVYAAIVDKYPVQTVVKAGLETGAPLDEIINAATSAGADKKSIYAGAAEAGAPPALVANAISGNSSPGSPVFGYSSPVDAPPSVYTPHAPVAIGGGGGGTPSTQPSTQPASPYTP